MASERARVRSDHAALVAVGRLRAPQSVFNPLHRTPSRPEMRRSITHGRFSPVGRKLWRQSEGLSPRTGQLCLSPRRRERGAEGFGGISPLGGSGPGGNGTLDVAAWAELLPPLAIHHEESQWGFTKDNDVDTISSCHDGINDQLENRGNDGVDGSSAGRRYRKDMQKEQEEEEQETKAGVGEGGIVAEERDKGVPSVNSGGSDGDVHQQDEDGMQGRAERGDGSAVVVKAVATAPGGEEGAVSKADHRHDKGVRDYICAGANTCCGDSANLENGEVKTEPAVTARGDPESPPSPTITRCLSCTVSIPWDGQK